MNQSDLSQSLVRCTGPILGGTLTKSAQAYFSIFSVVRIAPEPSFSEILFDPFVSQLP